MISLNSKIRELLNNAFEQGKSIGFAEGKEYGQDNGWVDVLESDKAWLESVDGIDKGCL